MILPLLRKDWSFFGDDLYEGTGMHRQSTLRRVELSTGKVLKKIKLGDTYFGEGITIIGDRIYQLTWQSKIGFIYNRTTFEKIKDWKYPTEGWGLTHDDTHLILSDGSSTIFFYDIQNPEKLIKKITVKDKGKPINNLNELEYIDGEIYANVWLTDNILRFNPNTGRVTAWIDLLGLKPPGRMDVLNGIAYHHPEKKFYVTGKYWPQLFQIEFVPKK